MSEGLFARDADETVGGTGRATREFLAKPQDLRRLINEAIEIMGALGVPVEGTPRRLERQALALLAVADVDQPGVWHAAQDRDQGRTIATRQIIDWWNERMHESVSSGSYDDVRRKDLLLLLEAGVVVRSNPDAARNDPSRAYALSPEYAQAIRQYGNPEFDGAVAAALAGRTTLAERLAARRELARVPVHIGHGVELKFGPGEHNLLIRAVIEEFLPRYGGEAEVLYVGDAEDRDLHYDKERLDALGFFNLEHGELPDVVAYSEDLDWLYLVEAVHSSGPISPVRHSRLQALLTECSAGLVYVTAFFDRAAFRRWVVEIAWETEVWIASEPDHVVHFDGERFLGPYGRPPSTNT